jgi:hypothetical protein
MSYRYFSISLLLALFASSVFAHGGEDHGAASSAIPTTSAWPSAEAHSDDFELFAQLRGERLTVYLDGYADNQPVANASIELESAGFTTQMKAQSPGQYSAEAAPLAQPGEHALTFTLRAGEQFDLLETPLMVRAPAAEPSSSAGFSWRWGVASLIALLLSALLLARRYARPASGLSPQHGPSL